jgi:hypothetical protein
VIDFFFPAHIEAFCPCVYVEAVHNASLLSIFEYGDEIVSINGWYLLGRSLEEVEKTWKDDKVMILFLLLLCLLTLI